MTDSTPEEAAAAGGLTQRAAVGAVWTTLQKLIVRITGLATVAILARLLSPSDFGSVAAVATFIPILQMVADFGVSDYILQAKRPIRSTYNTFLLMSASIAIVECGLLLAAAPFAAMLFQDDGMTDVIRGLAPVALLITVGAVPQTILRRQMKFRELAVQSVIAGILSQAVAIAAAFAGWGVWALILQSVVVQLVATVLAWAVSRYRPSLEFSRSEFAEMYRFGLKVVASQVLGVSVRWVLNVIVALALGVTALGYLNIAQRLISVVSDLASATVHQVSTVMFARIREDVPRLRAGYRRAMSMMLALLVPSMVFLSASSAHLIPLMFGDQWGPSIVPAMIIAIASILSADELDTALYFGIGRPGVWLWYLLGSLIVELGVTIAFAPLGLTVLAWVVLGMYALFAGVRWWVSAREIQASWLAVFEVFLRVAVPGGVAAGAGFAAAHLTAGLPYLVGALLTGLVIVAVYLPLLRLTAPATWAEGLHLVRHALERFVRRPKAASA